MADLPEHGSFDGLLNRKHMSRRLSYQSQNSTKSLGPHVGRVVQSLRPQASSGSIRTVPDSDAESEIHSPIPRRHLLLQTDTKHWLKPPPLSPSSSRAVSPLSTPQTNSFTTLPKIPKKSRRGSALSFSSLKEFEDRTQERRASLRPSTINTTTDDDEREGGAGKRWIRWMHKHGMKHWVVPCTILASVCVKWSTGLGSYSGAGTPPMFGDYEAQRHWMEITTHLPIRKWYTYDLPYWGLDYPPLTAYHSWLFGILGNWINPEWFALDKSRGIESPTSKVYMRFTVLASDLLVYVPALLLFLRAWHGSRSRRTQNIALLALLFQPSLILIDSGHFQYNSVMLGLTLLSMNFLATGHDLLAAVCFVLSLGFKQMALYYAPAIGSYLLGKCLHLEYKSGIRLFLRLGATTLFTFYILFLPFLPPFASISSILEPISRIFPFGRGLFEDKVANFWCASNVVFKWRQYASTDVLVKCSAALTALGFLPSVVGLILGSFNTRVSSGGGKKEEDIMQNPTLPLLPYALLTSSMSFFLFSFQVHEKTILLPLLPITLLLSGAASNSSAFEWGVLVNNVAVFSMWPLLKKDGLGLQYVALTVLWNWIIGANPLRFRGSYSFIGLLSAAVYTAIATLHLLELVLSPPARYPDLFPVLNVLVSTPVFVLTWLWSIKRGIEVSWALGGVGLRTKQKGDPAGPSTKKD
ncbi:hypothetical protein BD410DRAFT_272741 [Rickenella mellea]|uniref:Alpha-1,3-glucosyltransferase n=1 Tax=Rickenella mellea TaxID=50990 RepID=A0A4Y7Q4Z3_9AGAM|nr:hypothetical protein BD410DRAFT_272741 [Rickenella mellea]